jgi:hypothetical protein
MHPRPRVGRGRETDLLARASCQSTTGGWASATRPLGVSLHQEAWPAGCRRHLHPAPAGMTGQGQRRGSLARSSSATGGPIPVERTAPGRETRLQGWGHGSLASWIRTRRTGGGQSSRPPLLWVDACPQCWRQRGVRIGSHHNGDQGGRLGPQRCRDDEVTNLDGELLTDAIGSPLTAALLRGSCFALDDLQKVLIQQLLSNSFSKPIAW